MGEEAQPFEVVVQPLSDRYDPDDDRWRDQVAQLFRGLDDEVGGVRRETVPVEGTKGGLASIIVALGSAGAFTVSLEYFKAWLGRDKSRKLEITWKSGEHEEKVTVQGDGIDQSALQTLAEAAAKRLGEAPPPS